MPPFLPVAVRLISSGALNLPHWQALRERVMAMERYGGWSEWRLRWAGEVRRTGSEFRLIDNSFATRLSGWLEGLIGKRLTRRVCLAGRRSSFVGKWEEGRSGLQLQSTAGLELEVASWRPHSSVVASNQLGGREGAAGVRLPCTLLWGGA